MDMQSADSAVVGGGGMGTELQGREEGWLSIEKKMGTY